MERDLICGDCNMVFRSAALLEKHKARFCIRPGTRSEAGHIWVQRHGSELPMRDRPGCEDPKQTRTPDLVQVSESWCLCCRALRRAYMQSGGSDPAIVARMIDLQAEAQSLEKTRPASAGKSKTQSDAGQKTCAASRCITQHSGAHDINSDCVPPQRQARSFSSPPGRFMSDSLDSLGPAPYNPTAGFVVFYDMVLGAEVSQRALRLVAALYSEGQEVGPPTALPPAQCLPYTHSLAPANYALLSFKQSVPRIQPSPSFSLVVEVHAARDLDVHAQEVFKLAPCGWAQMQLFDQFNQLHSGHWRVPLRCLPIRPSLSLAQLNSVPQVGNMELCVRLVNGRDEDVQTLAKPDPASTSHYKYPAMVGQIFIFPSKLQ
uniref:Coiled-coil domain containing 17 n=1 Tax=Sparus aurata TaxID=8175 RepID=A0A671Y3M8_SPAAU